MPMVELPRKDQERGNGSATCTGYVIEVRTTYYSPTVIDKDFVIDCVWRQVPIQKGVTPWGLNIPVRSYDTEMLQHGLLSFTAANALMWGFLAWLESSRLAGSLCIQTRLVAIEYVSSYKLTEVGVTDEVNSIDLFRALTGSEAFHPRVAPILEESKKEKK